MKKLINLFIMLTLTCISNMAQADIAVSVSGPSATEPSCNTGELTGVWSFPTFFDFNNAMQVDFDGTFEYSDVVAVRNTCQQEDKEFTIYPNPIYGSQELRVQLSSSSSTEILRIQSLEGRTVQEHKLGTVNWVEYL